MLWGTGKGSWAAPASRVSSIHIQAPDNPRQTLAQIAVASGFIPTPLPPAWALLLPKTRWNPAGPASSFLCVRDPGMEERTSSVGGRRWQLFTAHVPPQPRTRPWPRPRPGDSGHVALWSRPTSAREPWVPLPWLTAPVLALLSCSPSVS